MNTFGGNPVSCVQAMNVLKIIKREKLMENAEKRGNQILKNLRKIQEKCEFIGDVRGEGLLIGIEIVENKKTKKENPKLANEIMEETKNCGLLIGKGGFLGNVIRLTPSYVITEQDADFITDSIAYAIDKATSK